MRNPRLPLALVAITLIFSVYSAMASEGGTEGVGFYSVVSGQVSVTHPGEARVLPVKLHDGVLFKDVIQTQDESRTKAFFQDDSMLTVGENSRVEINEYIYKPDENVRQAIVKLVQGQVRALVSKVFKTNGSKFEIHTPSAVAAARGTYFTVWVENKQSGIINIGEKGRVDFTSNGITVAVDPGYFSVAYEGEAPSAPVPHRLGQRDNSQNYSPAGLAQALTAVERTILREEPLALSPAVVLETLNQGDRLMKTMKTALTLSTESVGGIADGRVGGVTGGATVGTVTTAAVSVGSVALAPVAPIITTVIATPPAVINGALNLLP